MSSGKQTSFQFGEISPSLRFRSDAVSYSAGLSKLRNMYVRKAGGVSNRSGLEFIKLANSQLNIPSIGESARVKTFVYWSPIYQAWVGIEISPIEDSNNLQVKFLRGSIQGLLGDPVEAPSYTIYSDIPVDIGALKFTVTSSFVLITPGFEYSAGGFKFKENIAVYFGFEEYLNSPPNPVRALRNSDIDPPTLTSSLSKGKTDSPPYFPVTYLITANLKNGEEIAIQELVSADDSGNPASMVISFPTALITNAISLNLNPNTVESIDSLSLYRATGKEGVQSSYYSFVGKQKVKPSVDVSVTATLLAESGNVLTDIADTSQIEVGMVLGFVGQFGEISVTYDLGTKVTSKTATTITLNKNIQASPLGTFTGTFEFFKYDIVFTDYGASDAATTPLLDVRMLARTYNTFPGSPIQIGVLGGALASCFYQQRLVASLKANITESAKAGTILASKIGAPSELKSPTIFRDTQAFYFNIPITDGTDCHAMLPMERLIAFTERGTYAIRGGEQGILTSTQINPLLISKEGCSKIVEPKMAGRRGYFLNSSHTKLMGIEFGIDGNLSVYDVSEFSGHLITDSDIHQLEVIEEEAVTVYALRRDGKIIRITASENGAHGFSLIETENGFIESIYRSKQKSPLPKNIKAVNNIYYDVLMCYVIRNGKRILERFSLRNDTDRSLEKYLDCSRSLGARLLENGAEGYVAESNGLIIKDSGFKINFPVQTWEAGEKILRVANPDELPFSGYISIFYGNGQRLLVKILPDPIASGDPDYPLEYEVIVYGDIPEDLQDVHNKTNLTQVQKNYQLTNWLFAYTGELPIIAGHAEALGLSNSPALSLTIEGELVKSPLNPSVSAIYAEYNEESEYYYLDIQDQFWTHLSFGLSYRSEFETLDLETGGGRTITDSKKLINCVGLGLMETRGGFAGIPEQTLENMTPITTREDESFSNQTKNFNGHIVVHIPSEWNEPGRATIKHVDPSPISILSVYPKGIAGD